MGGIITDSQNKLILQHMKEHPKEGITSLDAIRKYGITRLSGRIFDLRRKGHVIEREMEKNQNNDGKHARYFLIKEAQEKGVGQQ